MDSDSGEAIADVIHHARYALRVDRLGIWSKDLSEISLLDLHILELAAENSETTLKEIRRELGIPHSTLTSAINRLET